MKSYDIVRYSYNEKTDDVEQDLVELGDNDPYIAQLKTTAMEWLIKYKPDGCFEDYLTANSLLVPEELKHLVKRPERAPEPPAAKPERTSFVKALEDAFWQAGGPSLLTELARENPLEFIKICSKLIPVDVTNKAPQGGFAISFNITAPVVEDTVLEHEEAPDD
jgi:hypothetical protein